MEEKLWHRKRGNTPLVFVFTKSINRSDVFQHPLPPSIPLLHVENWKVGAAHFFFIPATKGLGCFSSSLPGGLVFTEAPCITFHWQMAPLEKPALTHKDRIWETGRELRSNSSWTRERYQESWMSQKRKLCYTSLVSQFPLCLNNGTLKTE